MDYSKEKLLLGSRIKAFRIDKKYTQEYFASILNLEQSNLSNIEKGKTFPNITTLCTLISKTNIEPNYLLDFLRESSESYSTLDIDILNILMTLPKEAKENFLNFLINLKN